MRLKSSREILEKGMKYVKSLRQRYQRDGFDVVLVSLLLSLKMFPICFCIASFVEFEIINSYWVFCNITTQIFM